MEWAIDISKKLDESQRHYTEWKKTVSEGYMLYLCIYIYLYNILEKTKLEWQNRSVVARDKWREMSYDYK